MPDRPDRAWADPQLSTRLLARWRERWAGGGLFRVSAGEGWIRLHLAGDEHPGLILCRWPLPVLLFSWGGRLPEPLARALDPHPRHPLGNLLVDCRLTGLGMLPEDRIAAFRLTPPDDGPLFLLHQLFGARGNTALLDGRARLVWADQRPPHPGLAEVPPPETWSTGADEPLTEAEESELTDRLAAELARARARNLHAAWSRQLTRQQKAADKLVANLGADQSTAEKAELFRRQAEALAAHLHELAPGANSAQVSDPYDGRPLQLPLDPALSPAANLEAYFRKARKARKGVEVIAERLQAARRQADRLAAATMSLEQTPSGEGTDLDSAVGFLARLHQWRHEQGDLLPDTAAAEPRPGRSAPVPALPFRRFLIAERWEVWVGRSNRENDELTHEAAHSKDIWLHAQGVPGSHVILRTGGRPEQVPKVVLEQAASLAALHSKARHSELVPVVWTERRYVRKPRKSPPGTAVCQREKTIFARPEVPAGVLSL